MGVDLLVFLWRELAACTGSCGLMGPLEITSSSLDGLFFCSLDWLGVGNCDVVVVGVIER